MFHKGAVAFLLCIGCITVPDVATERDAGPFDAPCLLGNAMCAGECANIDVDPNNCGECGNVCDLQENCSQGVCTSVRPLEFALFWRARGDMNLHVLRPDGVEIYWDAPFPEAGDGGQDGALNYNDTEAQGPERITFHTPVSGDYFVCANNFGQRGIDPEDTWVLRVFENGVERAREEGAAGRGSSSFRCTAENAVFTYTR